jgi:hypothetical protein
MRASHDYLAANRVFPNCVCHGMWSITSIATADLFE